MPVEIIAYTRGEGNQKFGDLDVLEGTEQELSELKQHLMETWEAMGGTITIVYSGTDRKAARNAILGLPRVSEEISF